ncbi:MAG: hypothetical protein ACRC5C_05270 [Bacilli bacterium]
MIRVQFYTVTLEQLERREQLLYEKEIDIQKQNTLKYSYGYDFDGGKIFTFGMNDDLRTVVAPDWAEFTEVFLDKRWPQEKIIKKNKKYILYLNVGHVSVEYPKGYQYWGDADSYITQLAAIKSPKNKAYMIYMQIE